MIGETMAVAWAVALFGVGLGVGFLIGHKRGRRDLGDYTE